MPGGIPQEFVDVVIELTNDHPTVTYHALATLRGVDYDQDSRTLFINVARPTLPFEQDPKIKVISAHVATPDQIDIAPGSTRTLNIAVPRVVRRRGVESRLSGTAHLSLPETVIATAIDHVRCTIAYSDTPYYRSSLNDLEHLRSWGNEITETIRVTSSPRASAGNERSEEGTDGKRR